MIRLLWVWAIFLLFCACARGAPAVNCQGIVSPSIDEVNYLSELRQYHQRADLVESTQPGEAIPPLTEALSLTRPKGKLAQEAYLDVVERKGRLLLRSERIQEALSLVTGALAIDQRGFYAGSLQTLLGEIHQQSAKESNNQNDVAAAAKAEAQALAAFHRASEIHRATLDQLLSTHGASP
jgi:hypothetical protein